MTNPLLEKNELPAFDRIEPEHVEPAVATLLDALDEALPRLEESAEATWAGLIEPMDEAWDDFGRAWGAIRHLHSVKNTPELREAYQAVQPRVVAASLRWAQSLPLVDKLKAIQSGEEWGRLDDAQRRIIEKRLLDARLAGIDLEGDDKERFNAIQTEMSELSTSFSNHVLDATKAFALELSDAADVEGLPESAKEMAAQAAAAAGEEGATGEAGPWRITLDYPSYVPFMQHAKARDQREKLYRAHVTKASTGDLDNSPLIDRILELRAEQAKLLGFATYAELSLATKMASDVASVDKLLDELVEASRAGAEQDLADLKALAASGIEGVPSDPEQLTNWDWDFLAERLREERYSYTDEEVRPYFPLPRVLDGLFALVKRIFKVEARAADGEAPVWNDDVRFFRIYDEAGEPIAAFYLDPYSRPENKRGGAWMDECVNRRRLSSDDGPRLPVAQLVCNQTPPVGDTPSLMSFREVETLFHEFGHGLQHMLTRVDYPDAAGINGVEWDAVELPSQFMENWCYHRPTLLGLAKHHETGETLPDALFDKINAARTYRAGSMMLRQIDFARTDLELHHRYSKESGETPFDVRRRISKRTVVTQPLPEDKFLCGFSHIFAGGYAAGYYSYKWAEVLSADAFAAFEEAGLDDEAKVSAVGGKFRETVLGLGGSQHPMDVFKSFRGREPATEALLRHSGLATNETAGAGAQA
jgi:oligopeptidase A